MATDAIISVAIKKLGEATEKLGDLIIQEAKFLYGVREKVKELHDQLVRMRGFLTDAEKKQYESERVRNWISEIRDAAYDAEDVLEDFALEIQLKKQDGFKGTLKRVACFVNEGLSLHKIGSQVEEITTRLSKIAAGLRDYGVQEAMEREQQDSWLARQREKRQSFPHVLESDLVGVEGHITKLVSALVDEDKKFRVVSICGMGGLGKTTLAKQVYNHQKVRKHFNGFAWTFISQQCQRRETWEGILKSLSNDHTLSGLQDQELAQKLYDFLRTNKCLVVLDDIWTSETWDRLKDAFPQESNSKIFLTSRNKDVALHADSQVFLYEPDCLNDEQSWELLQKIVFPERSDIDFKVDNRMEELGKHMIKQCAGLPLAIRVLGGMLMKKCTLREWQRINENVIACITKGGTRNTDSIDGVLSLSYEELSSQLKMCFLCLAQFPEDYAIKVDKLLKLWSADGLITDSFQGEREDVAEFSLDELIERSMVFVGTRDDATSRIQTCRLHDLMRDLCLSKAKQENFATVIDPQIHGVEANFISSLSIGKVRRVVIHFFEPNDSAQFRQKSLRNSCLRSLIYSVPQDWKLLNPSFKDFKFLRVLGLEGARLATDRVPKDLGKLIHLRFLSFRNAYVSYFPSSLGKLRLMETLHLDVAHVGYDEEAYLPDVLWKMKKLRHLYLPYRCNAKTRLQLRKLEELRTLENFPVGACDVNDLLSLTKLKTLTIYRTPQMKALEEPIMPSSSSAFLKQLQSLSLNDLHDLRNLSPPAVDLRTLLPGFIRLSELILQLKITKLTDHHTFPSDITSISLVNCGLEEDPMPILEKLPELRVLRLGCAYTGKEIICSKMGFPKLHYLYLCFLHNLEEWRLDDGGMPCISKLNIGSCKNLKKLPEALKGIDTLQELVIESMPKSFKDELSPRGCDFYKIQHVPSVVFRHCDDDGS